MPTRRGIYNCLKNSPYKFKIDKHNLELCFSSNNYLNKYEEELFTFNKKMQEKVYNSRNISINLTLFTYIWLYHKIEKRGFYILRKTEKGIKEYLTIEQILFKIDFYD